MQGFNDNVKEINSVKEKKSFDLGLLGLIAALAAINIPMFINKTLPFIDTFYVFQQFYYTYNELFLHHEFPLWMPFSSYGQQFNIHLLSSLSPASYLAIFAGLAFKVTDVMPLFKVSLFLEQMVLLYGAYLLSKSLFKHRATVLFVCIPVIATGTILQHNIYFNFRIFYMLPLIVYFINQGFERKRLSYFAAAMLIFGLQGIGLVPYMVVMPLFVVTVLTAALAYIHRGELKQFLKPSKSDIIRFAALIVLVALLAGALLLFVRDGSTDVSIISPGRSEDGRQTIESFLAYGGETGTQKFFDIIFPIHTALGPADRELVLNNIFVFSGILPLIFGIYLLVRRKFHPLAKAMLVLMGVLVLFSIGKTSLSPFIYHNIAAALLILYIIVRRNQLRTYQMLFLAVIALVLNETSVTGNNIATVLYYAFPGMKYYRHIGYSANFFKIILPFIAGFGLDLYLDSLKEGLNPIPKVSHTATARILLSTVAVVYVAAYIYQIKELPSWVDGGRTFEPAIIVIFAAITGAGIYLFELWRGKSREIFFASAVIFIIVFEMVGLRFIVDKSYADISKGISVDREVTEVYDYKFHGERTDEPVSEHARKGMELRFALHPYGPDMMNNQLYWSMCCNIVNTTDYKTPWYLGEDNEFRIRVDTVNSYVSFLGNYGSGSIEKFFKEPCDRQVLSLMKDAHFVDGYGAAIAVLRRKSSPLSPMLRVFSEGGTGGGHLDLDYQNRKGTSQKDRDNPLGEVLALTDVPDYIASEWESAPLKTDRGEIRVLGFRVNGIDMEVSLPEGTASWLFFTDAWNPNWKAYVNGTRAYVAHANVAFKAVLLKGGLNKVSFVYENNVAVSCIYVFAFMSIIFMLLVLANVIRLLASSSALGNSREE